MGSSSRNSHDTLWLWLSVKFPVLVQLQQTKQTAPRKGYGNYFVFLLVFPVKCFLSRGTEKGRKEPHTQGVSRSQKLQGSKKRAVSVSGYLSIFPGYCQLEFISFLQLRDACRGMIGNNLKPLCR